MRNALSFVLATLMMSIVAVPSHALEIGQPAPKLTITDWVKGKPMDVLEDGKGKVIMIEFWATWCPPCIQLIPETTKFYQEHKDEGLIVVGLTDAGRGQDLATVRDFVSRQGEKMDYPVAFDSTMQTTMTYQAYGLPHAVVISKEGKVVWTGHPAMPEMKQVVLDLLNDRFDMQAAAERAAMQAKLERLTNEFYLAANAGNWDEALAATDRMLEVDPGNFEAMQYKLVILVEEMNAGDRLESWAKSFIQKHADNADALVKIGHLMLQLPDMAKRQPKLAISAAQSAIKADPNGVDTLQAVAQIYFQIGDLQTAMRYQRQALGTADEDLRTDIQAVLDYFATCQSLHASADTTVVGGS